MIKIKYNGSDTFEEVNFSRNGNLITISPTFPHYTGFTTWRLDGKTQLGDFSEFDTVYKSDGYAITYSNDGSVYKETSQPTEEELKRNKIESEINAIKQELSTFDYIGTKIAMGVATKEEYAEKIAYTERLRVLIRELESQLDN